jgi:hypothetical protein
MARKTHALAAPDRPVPSRRALATRLHLTDRPCGRRYGHASPEASEAVELFALDGVRLEQTYSAKAAATLVAEARGDSEAGAYVFWLTFAAAPASDAEIPSALAPLLLAPGTT